LLCVPVPVVLLSTKSVTACIVAFGRSSEWCVETLASVQCVFHETAPSIIKLHLHKSAPLSRFLTPDIHRPTREQQPFSIHRRPHNISKN
jgi:hypothetical protein